VAKSPSAGAEVGDTVAGWGGEWHSWVFTFLLPLDGRSALYGR
jgi:hypothetical protein